MGKTWRDLTLFEVCYVVIEYVSLQTAKDQGNDFAGRLSSTFSFAILILFALVMWVYAWFRTPVLCWVPMHFTNAHRNYAESFCWVKNTYYLPYHEEIPGPDKER